MSISLFLTVIVKKYRGGRRHIRGSLLQPHFSTDVIYFRTCRVAFTSGFEINFIEWEKVGSHGKVGLIVEKIHEVYTVHKDYY